MRCRGGEISFQFSISMCGLTGKKALLRMLVVSSESVEVMASCRCVSGWNSSSRLEWIV